MKNRVPYWYLLAVPILLVGIGALSNQIVLKVNGGRFPVQVNTRKWDKMKTSDYNDCMDAANAIAMDASDIQREIHARDKVDECMASRTDEFIDNEHVRMTPQTRLNFLGDWLDFGVIGGINSPGDLLIDFGQWIMSWSFIAWGALILRKAFNIE